MMYALLKTYALPILIELVADKFGKINGTKSVDIAQITVYSLQKNCCEKQTKVRG